MSVLEPSAAEDVLPLGGISSSFGFDTVYNRRARYRNGVAVFIDQEISVGAAEVVERQVRISQGCGNHVVAGKRIA